MARGPASPADHSPEAVATSLMRAVFTMFAEDVGLLPNERFTRTLSERWIPRPEHLSPDVQAPWRTMDRGGEEEEPAAKAAGPRTEPTG